MREICFSDTLTQKDLYLPEIVDSIAHEVEHAKQEGTAIATTNLTLLKNSGS